MLHVYSMHVDTGNIVLKSEFIKGQRINNIVHLNAVSSASTFTTTTQLSKVSCTGEVACMYCSPSHRKLRAALDLLEVFAVLHPDWECT